MRDRNRPSASRHAVVTVCGADSDGRSGFHRESAGREVLMRILFLLAGHVVLALALIGIFLPLLPTTPFLLLAGYCYSRGSTRAHRWLLEHPRLGPVIHDWERWGVIRPRAKWLCAVAIPVFVTYPLAFMDFSVWLKALVVVTVGGALLFVLTRPSAPPERPGD